MNAGTIIKRLCEDARARLKAAQPDAGERGVAWTALDAPTRKIVLARRHHAIDQSDAGGLLGRDHLAGQ